MARPVVNMRPAMPGKHHPTMGGKHDPTIDTLSFAELDASVQGWIAHVRYADSWGLRRHIFDTHPIVPPNNP